MDVSSFDDGDSPVPPRFLYKYLSAERVGNVLERGMVRFTPLINTNDTFEVRSTFDRLIGSKMLDLLSAQMEKVLSDQAIHDFTSDMLKEKGLGFIPTELALKIADQHSSGKLKENIRDFMELALNSALIPKFNDQNNINDLIQRLGHKLLCFSLSEHSGSAPMWAHYADNSKGFVVAFKTENEWFQKRNNGAKTRLQKVTYFDGRIEEPLTNPAVAFISKTMDWSYEREWRLYAKRDDSELTVIDTDDEQIHLLKFPPEAVHRIIIGANASDETLAQIKALTASHYAQAQLVKAVPNRQSHSYDEVPL